MNDLIRRKDVEQMLAALGGCDASDKEARGWDKAIDAALAQIGQTKSADNTQFEVTELCPHCEIEITVIWNTESDGLQIFCPNCGKPIMLCSMCDARDGKPCDWTEKGCKHSDDRYGRDRWIPINNNKPPLGMALMVTVKNHLCGGKRELRYPVTYMERYYEKGYSFYMNGTEILLPDYSEVAAWMPLPKPYKED